MNNSMIYNGLEVFDVRLRLRIVLPVLMVLLAFSAGSSFAQEAAVKARGVVEILEQLHSAPRTASIEVELQGGDAGTWPIGNGMVRRVKPEHAAYIYVVEVFSHGELGIEVPTFGNSGNFLSASQTGYAPESGEQKIPPILGPVVAFHIASDANVDYFSENIPLGESRLLIDSNNSTDAALSIVSAVQATADILAVNRTNYRVAPRDAGAEYTPEDIVTYFTETNRSRGARLDTSINFATGSAELDAAAREKLDIWGAALKNSAMLDVIIEIGGHADDRGDSISNQTLSERRADSVVGYLTSRHGIDEERLLSLGYGEEQPLIDGTSEAARAQNRRVEFKNASGF